MLIEPKPITHLWWEKCLRSPIHKNQVYQKKKQLVEKLPQSATEATFNRVLQEICEHFVKIDSSWKHVQELYADTVEVIKNVFGYL